MAAHPVARQAFEVLNRTHRYQIILKLVTARTPATRAACLASVLDTLAIPT